MGTAFRVLAVLLVVGVLAGLGMAAYGAGVSQGVAQSASLATASGTPAAIYGWYGPGPHWGWGFGLFGIVFWILGIFLVFSLVRFAFGWGRWGRHDDRWGGPRGPGGYGSRREMLEELHRELHQRDASGASGSGGGPAPSAS